MTDHIEDRAKAIYADQTMRHTGRAWNWDAAEEVVKEQFRERARAEITDTPTLHVVVGVRRNGPDETKWVAGIFSTRKEAEEKAVARMYVRHAHDVWMENYLERLRRAEPDGKFGTHSPEQIAAARAAVGKPEPEDEQADDFEYYELKLGEWKV